MRNPGILLILVAAGCGTAPDRYRGLDEALVYPEGNRFISDSIVYHPVRLDTNGNILPWPSPNLGRSYDSVLSLVWSFWKNMEMDSNGMPYYMNHQVWNAKHDKRGLGGDQLMMAMSSWDLYYNYTGDQSVVENMKYMADQYLARSLSRSDSDWPNLPYPYNMVVESGIYDGDMILGKGYLQPDKAGSFGYELVHLFKKTGERKYLDAAIRIANTLASKVQAGDSVNSPWPFKVHAVSGEVGVLAENAVWYEGLDEDLKKSKQPMKRSSYTTFWTGSMGLFRELIGLKEGEVDNYAKAFDAVNAWMKAFPAKTNKWGPFFEDVPRWSDTQINAVTYAMFIMDHPEFDADWKQTVRNIFQWAHGELDDKKWSKYGVVPIDEQTAYRQPGNSHSARQASMELLYWEKTGDTSYVKNAVRQLSWATYMVDHDGKNFYPTNAIWMTDGYGDYVRHYLRAMAAAPELAPDEEDHMLRTTSIVSRINYSPSSISYSTFDATSEETFRLTSPPQEITVNGHALAEGDWLWRSLDVGGVLKIRKTGGTDVEIIK